MRSKENIFYSFVDLLNEVASFSLFSMSFGDDEKLGSSCLPRCYTTSVVLAVRAVPPIRADMKTTGSQLHSVMNETVSSLPSSPFKNYENKKVVVEIRQLQQHHG